MRRACERSGRDRSQITLVAVTKKFSAVAIQTAYAAGVRHFGENYVQEFATKQTEIGSLEGACYHLIGHLQSNKARLAVGLFDVIHTVDSIKLLDRLDHAAQQASRHLDVLLEIKLSGEDAKSGAAVEEIPALLRAAGKCHSLRVTGLMTMPPWSEDAERSRPYFQKLAQEAKRFGLPQLSMGMSNDFEAAIEEGATLVRVGTALFGSRPKPPVGAP